MAFKLGTASRAELKGVHPDLVKVVERAIQLTEVDFTVVDGIRTVAQQKKYVASGASKTMNSKHLPQKDGKGHAVDLAAYVGGKVRWEWELIYKIISAVHKAAAELKMLDRLTWGAVWDRRMSSYKGSVKDLKAAVAAYSARRNGKPFLDGVHVELL